MPAAINGVSGTIQHQTKVGQPEYSTSDKSVGLSCDYVNASLTKGTTYALSYNFKVGYRYAITVTAAEDISVTQGPYLKLNITNNGGGGNTECTGAQVINGDLGGNPAPIPVSSLSFINYPFDFSTPMSIAHSTLEVSAIPNPNAGGNTIRIRKITIVETPPPFTLGPSSLNISCGSTAAQTFTVTNEAGIPGVTNYQWNLGASNGWLYNGSPASSTINTTAATLTLTPDCGKEQHNIAVTVTAGGDTYNTNASQITVVPPTLSITGDDLICTGSKTYTVSGVPCNGVATWSSSPSGIVTLTPNGNQVTVTEAIPGDVTLTAAYTAGCGGSATKSISVGGPYVGNATYENCGPDQPLLLSPPFNPNLAPNGVCYECPVLTNIDLHHVDYVSWSMLDHSAGASISWYQISHDLHFSFSGDNQWVAFQVYASGTCGSLTTPYRFKTDSCSGSIPPAPALTGFTISPNPAKNNIVMAIVDPQQEGEISKMIRPSNNSKGKRTFYIKKVQIYDASGKLQMQQSFSGDQTQAQMDVSKLSPGIYIVKITDGKFAAQQKLDIQ